MENFQAQLPDLRLSLHWTWLGHRMLNNKPFTVRVLCTELCAIDALLQMFSAGSLPWSIHGDASSFPSAQSRDMVLILSNNQSDSEQAIKMVAKTENAYRARYIVTHLKYLDNEDINDLASTAWRLRLPHVLVIRLEDRAVFATMPDCKLPRVFQVSKVKWPNLSSLDLSNCTLRVGMFYFAPFFTFKGDDETTLDGTWKDFFRFAQLALGFRATIVPLEFYNLSHALVAGDVDLGFTTFILMPNHVLDVNTPFTTELIWCVPKTCEAHDTSNILWKEFSATVWALLVTSLLAVSIAVRLFASAPRESLGLTIMRMIALVAATGVPQPPAGQARWPLTGWLMATLVLGCLYQTVLHSVMTAPILVHEIEDLEDLINSKIGLACVSSTCDAYVRQEKSQMEKVLETRLERVGDITSGLPYLLAHPNIAIISSSIVCDGYFTNMRKLPDYTMAPVMYTLYGVAPSSWLAPALRRVASQAVDSGLAGLWLFRGGTHSCSSVAKDTQPLGLHVFWPALLLMCIGVTLGAAAFVCEILCCRRDPAPKKCKRSHCLHTFSTQRSVHFTSRLVTFQDNRHSAPS